MLIEGERRVLQARIYLFGRPRLLDGEGGQIALPPSIWRLLSIVASQPDVSVSRQSITDIYWGVRRRGTLRKILWDLREIERAYRVQILEIDDRSVKLASNVYSDVRDLLAAVPEQSLSRIYRGPYLDGIDGEQTWTAWIADQREFFRKIYIAKAAASLADPGVLRGELRREAKRLLEIDPNAETALRVEMISDAIDGDISRLRSSYHRLERHLQDSGRSPSDQTRDLFTRLTGGPSAPDAGPAAGQDPGVPAVCILPPTGDSTTMAARLARSLVSDVTIGLCRNSLLRVMAPHTASQIRDARQAEILGASYLVTVDLLTHAIGREQVVCVLRRLPEHQILWSDRIDVDRRYSVETYNMLTSAILHSIIHHVDQATIGAYTLQAESSIYVDFLLGDTTLKSLDLRDIRRGRQHLRRAVDRSPRFAPAISALARSYQLEWILRARGDQETLSRSEHYARMAAAADPYEARAHRELGFSYLYSKKYDLSVEHYQRAERLNPQYADLIADYADALVHIGELEEARQKIERAISLNPLCQDTYFWTLGAAHLFMGNYPAAIETLRQMKDVSPVYRLLAAAHALNGDKQAAGECRIKTLESHPDMTVDGWLKIVSFRNAEQIQHYREGLQAAGFK